MELSRVPEALSSDHTASAGPAEGDQAGRAAAHWPGHPRWRRQWKGCETTSLPTGSRSDQPLQTPSSFTAVGQPRRASRLCNLGDTHTERGNRQLAAGRGSVSPKLCLALSFQCIPMPVLYGVFLYMGVASLNGIQVRSSPSRQPSKTGPKSPRPQGLTFPVQ